METQTVLLEASDAVAVLRLSNGVTNAVSPRLVKDLSQALDQARKAFRGAVIAGGEKFFSIGLDIPSLLPLNRAGMQEFWYAFERVVLDLFTLPLPTACAIRGHAVAGGTILALACVYRFAASGRKLIGLNEIRLGLPVPYLADLMLRQLAGDRAATEMLFSGNLMEAERAVDSGVMNAVLPESHVEPHALNKILQLAAHPPDAFSAIKANRVEKVRERFEKHFRQKTEALLDLWFHPKVQPLLVEAAKKF